MASDIRRLIRVLQADAASFVRVFIHFVTRTCVLACALAAASSAQADAVKVLGVTQPKISALRHYKLAGFSVERLMNLLTALGQDVEIVIRKKPRSRKAARITVFAA